MNDAERYAARKKSIVAATTGTRTCSGCNKELPITNFGAHPLGRDGRAARCKGCERDRLQMRKHGVTSADKDRAASEQGGCAICARSLPGSKGWVVDHDHSCCPGEVSCNKCRRGVLCQWCNAALGYAFDSPRVLRRMAEYIEGHLAGAIAVATPMAIATPLAGGYSTNEQNERTDVDE